ncbi:MAG: hypothetical protein E7812_12505 [Phenylobacterium sp.]|nr:MAG: hypothetical protein E7812_12505 [Phenylobacterium sp.]
MLSRALDQIFLAAAVLPAHLGTARREFGHAPETVAALERLEAALTAARAALAGGRDRCGRRRAASEE